MLVSRGRRVAYLLGAAWCFAAIVDSADDVVAAAARLGLRARRHIVRTADGHELSMYRVPGAGAPVLLIPGLLQGASAWLDAGTAGLAALLAGSGRDVWLGNVRGSHHSRRHAWLNPRTDPLYWRFSADEIGRYDLPAMIDHVLTATAAARVDYVGFSQGGGTFLMMCSELPDYCRKINLFIGLAPATRMLHTSSVMFRFLTEYYEKNEKALARQGEWEAFPHGGVTQHLLENLCRTPDSVPMCEAVKNVVDNPNPGSISGAALRATMASTPAGTSVHNMAWFGQHIHSNNFHKFDYGPEQNLMEYGSEAAPAYNLSAVSVPTVLFYGRNDGIVDPRDVKWLIRQLPNIRKVYEMEDPLWTHFDFVVSKNIPKILFPKIKEMLKVYSAL